MANEGEAGELAARREAIVAWGLPRLRDLPWRHTRDPWSILVAETMLQQTQVARVIDRYAAFLSEFPTTAACAEAGPAAVVRAWAGLGYNRRALALHGAASALERELGGTWPRDVAGLRRLPGVGPYTARAVLAFAFELPAAVVDTNVARVLARSGGRTLRAAEVQAAADDLAAGEDPWVWNQVMLDLGATVCTARAPRCDDCPLGAHAARLPVGARCRWACAGWPPPDPATGSAGVSGGQSRFEGSDRQGRGRLVDAMRAGPVSAATLAAVMGWPGDAARAERVAATLVRDGMAVFDGAAYRLP